MSLLSVVVSAIGLKIGESNSSSSTFTSPSRDSKFEVELVTTFAEFFLMRLDDDATMVESLEALHSLVQSGRLSRRLCELVLRKLFCDVSVHLQSVPQLVRRGAYWVLKCMLEDEIGGGNVAARHLGEELVAGFIGAMDAEKEPRNLLIALLIFPRLVWTIPQHVTHQEDLFEISSCYFPISFSERADDPNAIRKSSLISALRNTLCTGTEFWIPFLLEKLASSLIETKLEVLHSLHHALTWTISLNITTNVSPSKFSILAPLPSFAIESLFKPFKISQLETLFWRFEQVQPFVISLTNALIKEVINTTDEQVSHNATNVITDLTKFLKLSSNGSITSVPSPESRLKSLHELTDTVFKQCLPYLNLADPAKGISAKNVALDSKLAAMASKIVHAVTCGSEDAAQITLKRIVPMLENKWLQSPSDRSFVLRQLLNLCQATSVFTVNISPNNASEKMQVDQDEPRSSPNPQMTHPLADYAMPIMRILLSCLQESASYAQDQADAMEALAVIATLANGLLLPAPSLSQVLSTLYSKLIEHSHVESTNVASVGLKLAAIKAIVVTHNIQYPFIIEHSSYAPLWSELYIRLNAISESADERNYSDFSEYIASLHLLCDPSSLPSSHSEDSAPEVFLPTEIITLAVQKEFIKALTKKSDDSRIFSILLSSLSRTASTTLHFNLVFSLIVKYLSAHENANDTWQKAVQKWFPLLAQRVASTSLPTASAQVQFFEHIIDAFIDGNIDPIMATEEAGIGKVAENVSSRIMPLCFPSLCAVIVSLPIQSLIDKNDASLQDSTTSNTSLVSKVFKLLDRLFNDLISSNLKCDAHNHVKLTKGGCSPDQPSQIAEVKSKDEWNLEAFGSLLNKIPHPSSVLDTFVQNKLIEQLLSEIKSSTESTLKIQLFAISTKALIQRNHPKSLVMVNSLLDLLTNGASSEIKLAAASQMELLLEPRSAGLPFASPLYKQKVWSSFLPILSSDYPKANVDQQTIYMHAMSGMLQHLPRGVLLHSAPTLLPILLTGLKRIGESVCEEAVSSLYNMLQASESDVLNLLESHLVSVITPLVAIASSASPKGKKGLFSTNQTKSTATNETNDSSHANAFTRLHAVECLKILLKMPYVKILPWRNAVVEGLQPALDDPKRPVRKQVVATRNEWYLVGKLKQ
jgi:hypothetical protein